MKKILFIVRKLIVLSFWITAWQLIAIKVGKEVLVPTPVHVILKLKELSDDSAFYLSILYSVRRILTGFLCAVVFGTLLGMICAFSNPVNEFVSPVMSVIRATPVASFIILALVWITRENIPAFISFLMVSPIIFGNVKTGIQTVDKKLLEMAIFFKAGRFKTITKVYLPHVTSYLFSAVKTSLGIAWKAGVAAEVLCFPKYSIGRNIYNSKIYLETDSLFAWTLVIIVISIIIEGIMTLLMDIYVKRHDIKNVKA